MPLLADALQLGQEVGCSECVIRRSLFQQGQAQLQPGQEAGVEVGISQQREQGGGEAQGDPRLLLAIRSGGLQHLQQGQIALL